MEHFANSLSDVEILDWSKLNAFAENKVTVTEQNLNLFWDGLKAVGKGENAGNKHFLPFLRCFQNACFKGWLKVGIV